MLLRLNAGDDGRDCGIVVDGQVQLQCRSGSTPEMTLRPVTCPAVCSKASMLLRLNAGDDIQS